MPKGNLTSSLSIAFSGGPVGIITALLLAPALIDTLGWQWVFWICGATGLAWCAYWQPTVPEQPPALPTATSSAGESALFIACFVSEPQFLIVNSCSSLECISRLLQRSCLWPEVEKVHLWA